ncbi:MAG: hypothetical protein KKA62_00120 [Nanoarchaeota archaeon]|nr:hypothetical protein [Nanoarchaeota archaeon]MBU1644335.1 hypothetical protein [Nanoarchaeota archaeon]MBU1976342.1 hypothetical protein [Nanoarchaeota archaeon]
MIEEITDLIMYSSKETKETLEKDLPFVEQFCKKNGLKLTDLFLNNEEFPPRGFIYCFSDHLGGYNIKAIKESLREE